MFVGNLSYEVTREELIEAFGAAGKVLDAKVPTDRETGRPRGFAFIEFESDDAVQKSIAMLNGQMLKGRALRVNEAENRPPRPAGAGGPGGPSSFRPAFRSGPPPFGGGRGGSGGTGEFVPPMEDRARSFNNKKRGPSRGGEQRRSEGKRPTGAGRGGHRKPDFDDY